jgi:hypothetical protein
MTVLSRRINKTGVYPLSGKSSETVFTDVFDKIFDVTIPYNVHFFELLNNMVQTEPWITRDRMMINSLKAIGISLAFNPTGYRQRPKLVFLMKK